MKKIYVWFLCVFCMIGTADAMKNVVINKNENIIDARKANIKGLNKVQLLKRLFKAAKSHPFKDLLTIPEKLSHDEAVKIIKENKYISDLNTKTLNIDLSGDVVDTTGYNKINGDGKHLAEKIINQMRIEEKNSKKNKKNNNNE